MVRWFAILMLLLSATPSVASAQSTQDTYLAAIRSADQEMQESVQALVAAAAEPDGADRLVVGLAVAGALMTYDDAMQLAAPSGRERSHAMWLEGQHMYRETAVLLMSAIYGFTPERKAASLAEATALLEQISVLQSVRFTVWAQGY